MVCILVKKYPLLNNSKAFMFFLPTQSQGQMPMQFPPQGPFMNPFPGLMGLQDMGMNRYKSPLEALFGKPRFPQEELPPNMGDLIGQLAKMGMQVLK